MPVASEPVEEERPGVVGDPAMSLHAPAQQLAQSGPEKGISAASTSEPDAADAVLNAADHPVGDGSGLSETDTQAAVEVDARPDGGAPLQEGPVLHAGGCACAACRGRSAGATSASAAGSEGALSAASLGTLDQLADFLENQFWTDWGDSTRQFNLADTGVAANDGVLTYNTSGNSQDADGLTSGRADLVAEAFKIFEATLGIDFQNTADSGADFRFGDDESGAYASADLDGTTTNFAAINVQESWFGSGTDFGDYVFQTILHEIGHGLGLGHQGLYNGSGTYATDADFLNDSWQVAMMSYFPQANNVYFYNSSTNTSVDASFAFLSTPMVVDWIALDDLYGAQGYGISNAFLGNTTYGFNTTISASTSKVFNELKDWIPTTAFTVVDGGGDDTLDFSGFSSTQLIDLRPSDGSATNVYASNIGGKTGNLTIAPGTLIETAIGGSGADSFRGNSQDNSFDGGLGTDTLLVSGSLSDYLLTRSGDSLLLHDLRSGSPDGTDTLTNIEFVDFNGDTRGWASLLDLVDTTAPLISGPSGSAGDSTSATSVNENTTSVATFSADETVSWSLSGGVDQSLFSINSSSGALSFANAPDYESPQDSGGDNSYEVTVRAMDGSGNTSDQTVTVNVRNVNESSGGGSSGGGGSSSGSSGGGGGSTGGGGAIAVASRITPTSPAKLSFVGTDADDNLEGASDQSLSETFEGGDGNDRLVGFRGSDTLYGGAGNDELRAGNGMDLIDAGDGADQLYGGFGTNCFASTQDGVKDEIYFKSDQLAYNYIYDKAGNNPDGLKADELQGLDLIDRVVVQGARTDQLRWSEVSDALTHSGELSGVGLYVDGYLEAVYTGGDFSVDQLMALTTGIEI